MSDSQKPAELFRRSLDAFLAKDMRAWADLCAEDVLVEFPFAPAGTPSRLDGRVAIFEYLRNYPKIIDVDETRADQFATEIEALAALIRARLFRLP